jgi:lysophospholipase L1-like esterase
MDDTTSHAGPSAEVDASAWIRQADYIRFTALGDSATFGLGDPVDRGWRGWANLLADAIASAHHVSFCNLATPGATVDDVRRQQLPRAIQHQPVIASLVVGLNDIMRSGWDPGRFHMDLLDSARQLGESGALVITARFHDHGRAMGLPQWIARRMAVRIDELNDVYDEVHRRYGTLQIDLGDDPATYQRGFWATDRLHPSEHGHRHLAARVATLLNEEGLDFEPPSPTCPTQRSTRLSDLNVLVTKAAPWMARRLLDLTPAAVRIATNSLRQAIDRRQPT